MPKNKKIFIIYSNFWGYTPLPQIYYDMFKARGYNVKVEKDKGVTLQILSKN